MRSIVKMRSSVIAVLAFLVAGSMGAPLARAEDAYAKYVKTSKDFKAVKQDKEWVLKAFPNWVFMPWQRLGLDDRTAEFYKRIGWNGQTIDFRRGTAELDWVTRHNFRFYCDHTAGKGDLHIWDGDRNPQEIYGTGVRVKPVNAQFVSRLKALMKQQIESVKSSPLRLAYVLDDEMGWGHFSKPCMWQVTDDASAYPAWLQEIYGAGNVPQRSGWISYNDILPKLGGWKLKDFDASPLMDQWTFNDSYWNNMIGDLVEYANSIDPATPCGYEGAQGASPFGGFDVAKYMRKIQFLESYAGQSMIRSFNPRNALPVMGGSPIYALGHGNRGGIGWIEKMPDEQAVARDAPGLHDAVEKIGPLMSGAEWVHDGVAIYYNHASVQLGWIQDAQSHGNTWKNRKDDSIGTQYRIRNAWENMLKDDGIQFNYISYADVIQKGIPKEYQVLVLSDTRCLSDAEAVKIKEFCKAGGTVIADYMPGLWDQHGKGRATGGALDDMFGVKHDPNMGAADVFQGGQNGNLWVEVNQDHHYGEPCIDLKTGVVKSLAGNKCIMDASGYNKAVRNMDVARVNKYGAGSAVLMNLSPQWYNVYRQKSCAEAAAKRDVFTTHIKKAIGTRWVELAGAGDKESGYEITYWDQGSRMILFLCYNPEMVVSTVGFGGAIGSKTDKVPVTLSFKQAVAGARDERAGKVLGSGRQFTFDWKMDEPVVISFDRPAKPKAK